MPGVTYTDKVEVISNGAPYTVYSLFDTEHIDEAEGMSCDKCGKPAVSRCGFEIVEIKHSDEAQAPIKLNSIRGKEVARAFFELPVIQECTYTVCQICLDKIGIENRDAEDIEEGLHDGDIE